MQRKRRVTRNKGEWLAGHSPFVFRYGETCFAVRFLVISILLFLSGGASFAAEPHIVVAVSQAGESFIVDALIEAPVSLRTAWDVLTDFSHMTAVLSNLTSSKVVSREGNTLIVRQEGVARYGLLSFAFQSEREIRLEPMKRILAKNLSGTAKRMESEARLSSAERGQGVQIKYRAEIVPDSTLARLFGASFVRHEVDEQFRFMAAEMMRRNGNATSNAAPPTQKSSE